MNRNATARDFHDHGLTTRELFPTERIRELTRFAAPLGRVLFALIFLLSSFNHFSEKAIGYAASEGVPVPGVLVPISGVLALVGGLMLAIGYRARIGALVLIAFLVPVTLMMHAFWNVADPMMHQMQMVNFMKNVALTGGALAFLYFGAGPVSLDARAGRTS